MEARVLIVDTVKTATNDMEPCTCDYLLKPCQTDVLVDKMEKTSSLKLEQEKRIRGAKLREILSSSTVGIGLSANPFNPYPADK